MSVLVHGVAPSRTLVAVDRQVGGDWERIVTLTPPRTHFHFSLHTGAPGDVIVLRAAVFNNAAAKQLVATSPAVSSVVKAAPAPTVLYPVLASYYTEYGNYTACGELLESTTLGVANKTLPCGTLVFISYHGRTLTVPVIDRGPYVAGRDFDLTGATAAALGFDTSKGVDTIYVNRY
jgi:rare lipoprotein A (peptidoglycan hydrolase)